MHPYMRKINVLKSSDVIWFWVYKTICIFAWS